MTAMTRYIRKSPCKKVRSVPAENERKAEAVPFHENQNHKTLFLMDTALLGAGLRLHQLRTA